MVRSNGFGFRWCCCMEDSGLVVEERVLVDSLDLDLDLDSDLYFLILFDREITVR